MSDRLAMLLSRLEADLPADSPTPASLRMLGDRQRRRRRVVAVLVPVVLLAVLGGWLLIPGPKQASDQVISPAPEGGLFTGQLPGLNISFNVTGQLPAGWSPAPHPAFSVDLRNADGSRGVAIMVYPSGRKEYRSPQRAAKIAAAATGQNLEPTPTQFGGQPAWQLDAPARVGAALSSKCVVYPKCQSLFGAEFGSGQPGVDGLVGLLPHRSTRMIFTTTPMGGLGVVVWVWTTRPGDLPATLTAVQPMFDTLSFRYEGPGP